jgi:hypothetical protein
LDRWRNRNPSATPTGIRVGNFPTAQQKNALPIKILALHETHRRNPGHRVLTADYHQFFNYFQKTTVTDVTYVSYTFSGGFCWCCVPKTGFLGGVEYLKPGFSNTVSGDQRRPSHAGRHRVTRGAPGYGDVFNMSNDSIVCASLFCTLLSIFRPMWVRSQLENISSGVLEKVGYNILISEDYDQTPGTVLQKITPVSNAQRCN